MKDRETFLLIASFLLALIACVFYWGFGYFSQGDRTPSNLHVVSVTDEEWAYAKNALVQGDVRLARERYQKLLEKSGAPGEKARSLYNLAVIDTQDNPGLAIENLSKIAFDTEQTLLQRAYAVQRMGLTYYRVGDSTLLPIIFADKELSSFYDATDPSLSLRRLFEYAMSLHPLAISSMRASMWYTEELRRLYAANHMVAFEAAKSHYLPIINSYFLYADEDIVRSGEFADARSLIPEALYLKALNLARLASIGLEYEYEEVMRQALEIAVEQGDLNTEGSIRYTYALNLLLHERKREEEALALIEPLIKDIDKYQSMKRMFIRERTDNLGQKTHLVALATKFPAFKDLLSTLGWSDGDFVK